MIKKLIYEFNMEIEETFLFCDNAACHSSLFNK